MFFWASKNKENAPIVELNENTYIIRNMKLEQSTKMEKIDNDNIKVSTKYFVKSNRSFMIDMKWKFNISIYHFEFRPEYCFFELTYNISPNEISDGELKVCFEKAGFLNCAKFCLGDIEKCMEEIVSQPRMKEDGKRFLTEVVNQINFEKNIEFVKRNSNNRVELRKILNSIGFGSNKSKVKTPIFNKVIPIQSQISMLKSEVKELKELSSSFKNEVSNEEVIDNDHKVLIYKRK